MPHQINILHVSFSYQSRPAGLVETPIVESLFRRHMVCIKIVTFPPYTQYYGIDKPVWGS